MDNCESMQEAISLLLDGALGPEEERELRAHLAVCPRCRRSYDALRAFSEALRREDSEPPVTLRENVMAALRREAVQRQNRRLVRLIASAAAVAALALGLRFALPRPTRELPAAVLPLEAESAEAYAPEESFAGTRSAGAAQEQARLYQSASAQTSLAALLAYLDGEALSEGAALPAEPVATLALADGTLALYELDGALCCREPGSGALLRTARSLAEIEDFVAEREALP